MSNERSILESHAYHQYWLNNLLGKLTNQPTHREMNDYVNLYSEQCILCICWRNRETESENDEEHPYAKCANLCNQTSNDELNTRFCIRVKRALE